MCIRLDKCCTFGMMKVNNSYGQIEPGLYINNETIPPVSQSASFTYLGKQFSFDMKNDEVKSAMIVKLTTLLNITSNLKIGAQIKMKILKLYISSQMSFELRLYNLGKTWIDQNLDSLCANSIRIWMDMPVSSCVREFAYLPKNQGGLGIQSMASAYERLWLKKRFNMKHSNHEEMRKLWHETSENQRYIQSDVLMSENPDLSSAMSSLRQKQNATCQSHIFALESQGLCAKTINATLTKSNILAWSSCVDSLPEEFFKFARKAFQQQLPTASNLARWGRISSPLCQLCHSDKPQTNKHVLSNCSAPCALERYTMRHKSVLRTLALWLESVINGDQSLLVDLPDSNFTRIDAVFSSTCRPDIVVYNNSDIYVWELSVCHETNMQKTKSYKLEKYRLINNLVKDNFKNHSLHIYSIEVSVLGFMSDTTAFTEALQIPNLPRSIMNSITYNVLQHSKNIHQLRNTP